MIEYLFDAIRALAGNDTPVTAVITDAAGVDVTEGCSLMLHDTDRETMIAEIDGTYDEGEWVFTIPASITKELNGRYWYCIRQDGNSLCFKQPIYFVQEVKLWD